MKSSPKIKDDISREALLLSMAGALIFFFISLIMNYFAGSFATNNISNPVGDIFLDNISRKNVEWLFVEGAAIFWAMVTFILIIKPRRIPFILKSVGLFIMIRSISISLTHIAPFSNEIVIPDSGFIRFFSFGGDLFFSAHTGLPFLMALLFWHHKLYRYIFLGASILFAFVVLLGHYHYSIDVFAAFFITPTIAHLCHIFFKRDYRIFLSAK